MRETPAVQPDDPTGPSLEKELSEEERRRNQSATGDGGGDALDTADAVSGCGGCDAVGCDTPNCDLPGCDGCDGCDGCNLLVLVRLSSLLLIAAAVIPGRGGGTVARLLLRGYRRWLTRFTAACPSTPSCSAYALAAVETRGAQAGLIAAADRLRRCGNGAGAPARRRSGAAEMVRHPRGRRHPTDPHRGRG